MADVPDRETALITGASSGIGAELAKLFAADGTDLVLVARRKEELDALAQELTARHSINVHVLAEDLSRANTPQFIHSELMERGVRVDVLVNNAGFGALGKVSEIGLQRQADMIQVNLVALTKLTRLFLPAMVDRQRGAILNVGSTAGFQPGPNMAIYYASKAFVLSFSEALAEEVSLNGIKVSCLCPGPTDTDFREAAGMEDAVLFRLGTMTVDKVAAAGYKGLRKGKVVVVPGLRNKLSVLAVRCLPRFLIRKIVKGLQPLD